MVDEQDECGTLNVVVCIGHQTLHLEFKRLVFCTNLQEFVCNRGAKHGSDVVCLAGTGRGSDGCRSFAVLLQRKGHPSVVDRIPRYNLVHSSKFVCGTAQSLSSCRHVVKQVFDRDLGSFVTSARLWLGRIPRVDRSKSCFERRVEKMKRCILMRGIINQGCEGSGCFFFFVRFLTRPSI